MLAELRQALVDTVRAVIPEARYSPAEPDVIADNASGLFIYVEPDPSAYVEAWLTFSNTGRGVVNVNVVVSCPAIEHGPERAYNLLDRVIDPLSSGRTVFAALIATPTLGITKFEVNAVPHLQAVGGPQTEIVGKADSNQVRHVVRIPVRITVQRS